MEEGFHEIAPGVWMRLVHCSRELVATEARLARGARVPRHSHPSTQVTVVRRGRLLLATPQGERVLGPGDYMVIPPGVEHWGEALEDTLVLDVNAPLTGDRLELARRLGCSEPRG